ncbi:hypothetical protein [Alsobacter sp. SYSU BS001988]
MKRVIAPLATGRAGRPCVVRCGNHPAAACVVPHRRGVT